MTKGYELVRRDLNMYLEHFSLRELPFSLTPNTDFFCRLPGHQEAINTVLFALNSGEGFIKVTGEVGVGKTLICRELIHRIKDKFPNFITCYFPNPDLTSQGLVEMMANALSVPYKIGENQHNIISSIHKKLLTHAKDDQRVVLMVDEAQALNYESLEMLRLLTNLETQNNKLLHIILFAQPELDERLNKPELRQLTQRITFSYYVPSISEQDLDLYLCHRLIAAGHSNGLLFSIGAKRLLLKASTGIPRIINILCHKAMLAAYGKGAIQIDAKAIRDSVSDSKEIVQTSQYRKYVVHQKSLILGSICCLLVAMAVGCMKIYL